MTMSSLHPRRLVATSFLFAALGTLACEGDPATSPDGMQIRAAKPPKDGGGEIIVDSAQPPDGEQGDVGLKIHVLGSGFEKGAKVAFHLPGEADPDAGMSVKSTSFVSSTELIATTDIALDAVVDSRDISVSFRGRRGIGTETFSVKVTGKPQESLGNFILPDVLVGPGLYSNEGLFANEPLDQALIVDCDLGHFKLVRPADDVWPVVGLPEDEIHCSGKRGFSRLDLNDLGSRPCDPLVNPNGCIIGTDGHNDPDGFSFGPDLNYYFRVSTGKGKGNFASYNVVWTDALFTIDQTEDGAVGGTACRWHLWATLAEFWKRADGDVRADGGQEHAMALDVIVERQDLPCP